MAAQHITLRIPADLAARLAKATDKVKKPLAPSRSAVLLRGLELALTEIERKK